MYKNITKPILDFLSGLIGVVVLSPLFIVVTIALCFANNGKPFFCQRRIGKNERIFSIIKFKSMIDTSEINSKLMSDNKFLIITIGSVRRKTNVNLLKIYNE